jgi:uncharacterized protein YjiS (DUF1127 family)
VATTVQNVLTNCPGVGRSSLPRPSTVDVADWIKRTIRLWRSRAGERRSFGFISDRELRDLGLSRWDFEREIAKPFWRG